MKATEGHTKAWIAQLNSAELRDELFKAYQQLTEKENEIKQWNREFKVDRFIIKTLQSKIQKLVKLLKVAKCHEPNCDNEGTIACKDSPDDDWYPAPCQWCHDRTEILDELKKD